MARQYLNGMVVRWVVQLMLLLGFTASAWSADVDAVAARTLARENHCLRCHAVAKKKEGPAYQAVAYKYKGQSDAADKLFQHITSGEKVKLTDGHEENHKIAKAKDEAEVRNLVAWILAQ